MADSIPLTRDSGQLPALFLGLRPPQVVVDVVFDGVYSAKRIKHITC